MKDLTSGSIARHIVAMAIPMAVTMLVQTLYYFVDLYFVARLGDAAIAGVSAAGNGMFLIIALTQVLGVGAVALVSHAVGRKDRDEANLVFNQSLALASALGVLTLIGVYILAKPYVATLAADEDTLHAGRTYLYWFAPGLALQFAMVAMSSALRGTGIVKPTMIAQVATLAMNIVLAPILIAGWGTGYAMGVAGAGLASTISIAFGVGALTLYFVRVEKYVSFRADQWLPRPAVWTRMLKIGLPAGGEFALIFLFIAVTYWVIRDFGAAAQAGFGIGSRVMQGIFLPAVAFAFAAAPVAGQNFGAQQPDRVRETFRAAAMLCSGAMLFATLVCQWDSALLVGLFSSEEEVIHVGAVFLTIISWNFVLAAINMVCSSMFQALGNTVPALMSSATRLVTYAAPAIWLATRGDFQLEHVWYINVATVVLQTCVSLTLLQRELRSRLHGMTPAELG